MSAILANDEPMIERSEHGTVHLSFDDGQTWIQFRTVGHYQAVREFMDREETSYESAAVQRYVTERDEYHARKAS